MDSGKESLKIIRGYKYPAKAKLAKVVRITPEYISGLEEAESFGYEGIICHPKSRDEQNANNNSTVKQFRAGCFNVLSVGDVESANISARLRRLRSIYREVDVLIPAHQRADYGNKFEHSKQEIRKLLDLHGIRFFTGKTGDVLIKPIGAHYGRYEVVNLMADSSRVSGRYEYVAKRMKFLNRDMDSIRNFHAGKPGWVRLRNK